VIPLALALLFGAGVGLFYEGLTNPARGDRPAGWPAGLLAAWRRRVREFLVRAGLYDVTPRDFVLFSLGAGLGAGLVAQIVLGWGVVTVLAAVLGLIAPFAYYVRRHDRRRAALQDALADAIAQLRDAIRTGLSVPEALLGLAQNGPEPLRGEFARLVRESRFDGLEAALDTMRERLADPLFDVVAVSLAINDRLGGRNVSQVLDRLAHATRAQLQVQRELRAYQARNIVSARIVAALPLLLLFAIRRINPEYVAIFDSPWGQLLLAGCVASVAFGYVGMLWITRLPVDQRILGGVVTGDAAGAGWPGWGGRLFRQRPGADRAPTSSGAGAGGDDAGAVAAGAGGAR
jgi:tight adherence protein B